MSINFIRMLDGYRECAAWADCGPDSDMSGKDFSPELEAQMAADCQAFVKACGEPLIDALAELAPSYIDERFGHDFWLTRNGHGAGYWDREELGADDGHDLTLGQALTKYAEAAGTCELYLGDDQLVYAC